MYDKINSDASDFPKVIKEKIQLFVKKFENIYTELLIEHGSTNTQHINILKELLNSKDMNDISKKIFNDTVETKAKYKEYEHFFKDKSTYLD